MRENSKKYYVKSKTYGAKNELTQEEWNII